jgi:methyl-accepting chemotaxis protein
MIRQLSEAVQGVARDAEQATLAVSDAGQAAAAGGER